ncbi:kelch-like protein 10 [Limanda limanda]|uniref:kelch-like protein 10 n=1 Tax=Limanda limanda TaxID=27771 RepID=UPI0029C82A11|nr:kelch-like protein 10 [Limanda limanda]
MFDDLRLAGQFCDDVLQVEDIQFPIHTIIICDCSPYFQTFFGHQKRTGKVLPIPLVSPDVMQIIIEFAYTDSVAVTKDNVLELMLAADMLNIMGMVKACSNFIGEHLCSQNCIGIWHFTDICPSSELRCKAFHYIMKHFEGAVNCVEYLQLSVQELTEILDKYEVNVKNERTVFDVILRWIAHIPKEREQHMAVLLSKVRLGKTSIEYIRDNVITNKLVRLNPACLQILDDSLKIIGFLTTHMPKTGWSNTSVRPRLPNSLMWVTGGERRCKASCDIAMYDHLVDRWINISDKLESPRAYHSTVFLDGYVYLVGGSNLMERLNSMVRLDLRTHNWQEVMFMHYRRCLMSITILNGFIYALGGINEDVGLNTAERYCPKTNQWMLIAPMIEGRHSASCATLDGKIYICGGVNRTEILWTAECYDPETNQWTLIDHMTIRRSQHRVAAYNNQIYAIGGFNGVHPLKSVETYNPKTNTWRRLSPMLTHRSNLCLEVIEDNFYVVGGFMGITTTNCDEVYCPRTDTWRYICRSKMCRVGMSSCVVSGIPNMLDFTFPRDSLPQYYVECDPE